MKYILKNKKYVLDERLVLDERKILDERMVLDERIILNEIHTTQDHLSRLVKSLPSNYSSFKKIIKPADDAKQDNKAKEAFSNAIIEADKTKDKLATLPDANDKHTLIIQFVNQVKNSLDKIDSNWKAKYQGLETRIREIVDDTIMRHGEVKNSNTPEIAILDSLINKLEETITIFFDKFTEENIPDKINEVREAFKTDIEKVNNLLKVSKDKREENRNFIAKLDSNQAQIQSILKQNFPKDYARKDLNKITDWCNKIIELLLLDPKQIEKQQEEPQEEKQNEEPKNVTDWKREFMLASEADSNSKDKNKSLGNKNYRSNVMKTWDRYFKEYWADFNLDDDVLSLLKDALLIEIKTFGYTVESNPFINYLKILGKNGFKDTLKKNYKVYYEIHDAYSHNLIDNKDLRGTGELKTNNIIFCEDLYNKDPADAERYLQLQATAIKLHESDSYEFRYFNFNGGTKVVEDENLLNKKYSELIPFTVDLFYEPGNTIANSLKRVAGKSGKSGKIKEIERINTELTSCFDSKDVAEVEDNLNEKDAQKITGNNYKVIAKKIVDSLKGQDEDSINKVYTKVKNIIVSLCTLATHTTFEKSIAELNKFAEENNKDNFKIDVEDKVNNSYASRTLKNKPLIDYDTSSIIDSSSEDAQNLFFLFNEELIKNLPNEPVNKKQDDNIVNNTFVSKHNNIKGTNTEWHSV